MGPCRRSAAEKAAVKSEVVSSTFSAASPAAPYSIPLATVTRRSASREPSGQLGHGRLVG